MQMKTSGRSVVVVLLVALFLVGWLAWLVLARVPVYVVSDTAVLTTPTHATANFTSDALQSIESGQTALLRLDAFSELVPAVVLEVDQTLVDGRFTAQLQLQPSDLPLQAGLNGRVEVEVEQVSPFTLLLRSTR